MSDKSEKKLDEIINRRALTPKQQRRLWARATACRHFLVRAGLCTVEEFREAEESVLRDIEKKNAETIRKTVGADDEQDPDHDPSR